jgi:hypothetical protein
LKGALDSASHVACLAQRSYLLNHVTRALSRYRFGKLLIDQRQMTPCVPDEQVHLGQHWLPCTIVDGQYRYGAVVQAHDVFARLAMDTIRTQAQELPLTYRFFPDEAQAISWLHAQQLPPPRTRG